MAGIKERGRGTGLGPQRVKKIASGFGILLCISPLGGLEARTVLKQGSETRQPYKPNWVSVVKKGRLFQYKRREYSGPQVVGETIFLGSEKGFFYAVKKRNGRKIWRFEAGGPINSVPASDGEKVFFGDDKGFLYALRVESGEKLWQVNLASEIVTEPALFGGRLFVATVEGTVFAINSEDGSILWQRDNPSSAMEMTIRGNSPPVVDPQGRLYVGFADGTFWCLSSRDGGIVWKKEFPGSGFRDLDGAPLLDSDRIFVAAFDGPLMALSQKNGGVIWSTDLGSGVRIASSGDLLYVSGSHGSLFAISKKDGSRIWEAKIGEGALTAPVIHKEVLAVGLSDSTINFVDLGQGKVLYRRFAKKGISSDPVLDGDRLYYFSNGGRLYSLKLR